MFFEKFFGLKYDQKILGRCLENSERELRYVRRPENSNNKIFLSGKLEFFYEFQKYRGENSIQSC